MPNGRVREAIVTKSLDAVYGLDQQALNAVRGWRFGPSRLRGKPVPVRVTIEIPFTQK